MLKPPTRPAMGVRSIAGNQSSMAPPVVNTRAITGTQSGMIPPSQGPNASQRGLMDTIVQGALVDLFQSCGVAIAPQPRGRMDVALVPIPEVSAAINFTLAQSPKSTPSPGRLTLSLPEALFSIMKAESTRRPQQFDWVRELTNQLAARIKHRLLPFCASMQPLLPSLLTRDALEGQRARFPSMRLYLGRTLRGDALVTWDGNIDESRLIYSGPVDVGNAGDVIVF